MVTFHVPLQQILDNLSTVMREVCLLLQRVECNHLNSCSNIKDVAKQILSLVENFVPGVQNYKVLSFDHVSLSMV